MHLVSLLCLINMFNVCFMKLVLWILFSLPRLCRSIEMWMWNSKAPTMQLENEPSTLQMSVCQLEWMPPKTKIDLSNLQQAKKYSWNMNDMNDFISSGCFLSRVSISKSNIYETYVHKRTLLYWSAWELNIRNSFMSTSPRQMS